MITNIFPTPVYEEHLEIDNSSLIDSLNAVPQVRYNSDTSSTTTTRSILEFEEFSELKNQILAHSKKFIFDKLGFSPLELYVTSSWYNIHHNGDYSQPHTHPNSFYSGVYYLEIPKDDSGTFYFMRYHNTVCSESLAPDIMVPSPITSQQVNFYTPQGTLLIFPSHVWHGVTPNNTNERRATIAFNLHVRGLVSGLNTKYLDLK